MPAPPPSPSPSPLRGLVLRLVLSIVALDALAIGAFYALGVGDGDPRVRFGFVAVWIVATLVVCSYFLRRIRLYRRGWTVKR